MTFYIIHSICCPSVSAMTILHFCRFCRSAPGVALQAILSFLFKNNIAKSLLKSIGFLEHEILPALRYGRQPEHMLMHRGHHKRLCPGTMFRGSCFFNLEFALFLLMLMSQMKHEHIKSSPALRYGKQPEQEGIRSPDACWPPREHFVFGPSGTILIYV